VKADTTGSQQHYRSTGDAGNCDSDGAAALHGSVLAGSTNGIITVNV